MALVEKNAGKGAVLDTLTFWALVGMDGLHVVKKVFGRVLVPRSTADDITRLQEDDTIVEGGERKGSAYFHNGNFYFDEFTAEREQQISVTFNGKTVHRQFAPAATIARVKLWAATKEFGMTPDEAGEHVLQVTGTHNRPAPNTHIGTLVNHPRCQIAFNLVPDERVNGASGPAR